MSENAIIHSSDITSQDMVNHPSHYTQGKVEAIDTIKNIVGIDFEGYLVGTITKYLIRYNYKNGIEDLKKAQWYLNKLIATKEELNE